MEPWCVGCWTGKDQSSSYFSVLVHTFLCWKENLHNQGVNSHERWHKISKLISQSALISQLYLHFFQKLKYYTLRNKVYSRKLFKLWQLLLSNLMMRHYEASLRIQEQSPQGFHGWVYRNHNSLSVFKILIWLILIAESTIILATMVRKYPFIDWMCLMNIRKLEIKICLPLYQ